MKPKTMSVLILAAMTGLPAVAQQLSEDAISAAAQEWLERAPVGAPQGLEGSWAVTATPVVPPGVPPPPTLTAYTTFARGGALIGKDRTKPFSSVQHGNWVYLGHEEYAYTLLQDDFNAAGQFVGSVKVRAAHIILLGDGEYVGVASGEIRDAAGNIVAIRCARIRAVRIEVEPLPPSCAGVDPQQ